MMNSSKKPLNSWRKPWEIIKTFQKAITLHHNNPLKKRLMKNIVIIAHDAKKPEMVDFLKNRNEWIQDINLVATGRTAEYVESAGLQVRHMSPGKYGGYREINQMVEQGEIDIVIFFRDPRVTQPHHDDIQKLLDACDLNNIPIATNSSSAELLIIGLIKKEDYERLKEK